MSKGILNEGRVATCPACGVEFITKRINQKYCSDRCRLRSADHRRYQKAIEEKSLDPPKHCKCCGKRLEGRKIKYCSDTCKNIYYSSKPKGLVMKDETTTDAARCECTRKEECDYGINSSGTEYICGYILIEGHSRGCYADGDKCKYFKPRQGKKKRWCDDIDSGWS